MSPRYSALKEIIKKPSFFLWVYTIVGAMAAIHRSTFDWFSIYPAGSLDYINNSSVNNFTIYRNSFFHLYNNENLYGFFPFEQYDEFLYSPAFALFIMPFALLPKFVGVAVWCAFNAFAVYYSISLLKLDDRKKVFIYFFIFLELLTSIQNVQANPLVCALFVLTFVAFERKKIGLAALFIIISMSIKVFGILGAALFILYPQRIKFIAYLFLWGAVVFLSPIIFVSFNELMKLYQNWFTTLVGDHKINTGDVSVMRMFSRVSNIEFSETTRLAIQFFAVILFCIKYLRYKMYDSIQFRYLFLASVMIWSCIFNHAAESCSYVIAITGISIWYVQQEKNKWNRALLIFAYILTCLSPTDIFPKYMRETYVIPYALKSLPCLLIWIKIEYELLFGKGFILSKQEN